MKKLSSLIFLFTLLFISLKAQDKVTLKNGDEITVFVSEIARDTLRYRSSDTTDLSIKSMSLQDVFMIKYSTGMKQVFNIDKTTATAPVAVQPVIDSVSLMKPQEAYQQGQADAKMYYRKKGNFWGGFVFGLLSPPFSPTALILGLTGSGIIAAVPPSKTGLIRHDQRLKYTNNPQYAAYFKNPNYVSGYQKRAHKKKAGKVAAGYATGVGTAVFIMIIVFLIVLSIMI